MGSFISVVPVALSALTNITATTSSTSFSSTTVSELVSHIEFVEPFAKAYCIEVAQFMSSAEPNITMMYLRSFNEDYIGYTGNGLDKAALWAYVAGYDPNIFLVSSTVDAFNQSGYYFSQFVDGGKWGGSAHRGDNFSHPRGSSWQSLCFKDPVKSYRGIDLIHMFAVMDAAYENTLDIGFVSPSVPLGDEYVMDLASWAGDLQTAVNSIRIDQYSTVLGMNNFGKFMSVFGQCSQEDVLADIDGMIIARDFLPSDKHVSTAVENYYHNLNDTFRKNHFVDAVLSKSNSSWSGSNKQKFLCEVGDMLGLTYNNGVWKESSSYSNGTDVAKYYLLNGNKTYPSSEDKKPVNVRAKVTELFSDYVFGLC